MINRNTLDKRAVDKHTILVIKNYHENLQKSNTTTVYKFLNFILAKKMLKLLILGH